MVSNKDLIDTHEVAKILNISVFSVRDYKKRGLIRIADKKGNKDLYNKADVLLRYSIITEMRRKDHSLSQISSLIENELRQRRVA